MPSSAIRKASTIENYMLREGEHFMQVFNSYNGLLSWCNAWRVRRGEFEHLKSSEWRKVFDFHNNDCHVTLKPTATRKAWFKRKNRERKRQTPLWPR